MILGFGDLESLTLPPVVVIGAGPAALGLAQALDRKGIGALLLEAGSDGYLHEAQDLYAGSVIGDRYYDLREDRLMLMGGSGNHWAGRSRPLDAYDFLPRDDIPHMGWPITKADLAPYQAETERLLRIAPMGESPLSPDLKEVQFQFGDILNFGEEFRPLFDTSPDLHIAFLSRVTRLEAIPGRRTRLHVRQTLGERVLTLEPRLVVLATGGIENSRLLLWSNEMSDAPVVAEPAALGRYWMEHPHTEAGEGRTAYYEPNFPGSAKVRDRAFVAPTYEAMRRYGILNGVLGVRYSQFGEDAGSLELGVKHALCHVQDADPLFSQLVRYPARCARGLITATEQAPDPDNRVTLSADERDAHGIPRTVLHWRKTEIDRRTTKAVFELAGRYLATTGEGLIRANRWTIEGADDPESGLLGGHHHMGGTRMGDDPRSSVVDRNLRIHGMENLFVAGSSVFPTGGHANPTYSIIQLSLRLADRIAAVL